MCTKDGSRTDDYTFEVHRTEAWEKTPTESVELPLWPKQDYSLTVPLQGLYKWSDLMVLVVTDPDVIAKMLVGITDNAVLELLRGWNVSKKIFMIPGMTTDMWKHPLTKRQLDKIRRKFGWIQLFEPFTWGYEMMRVPGLLGFVRWDGWEDLLPAVKTEIDSIRKGPVVDKIPEERYSHVRRNHVRLPVELWSMILEELGDWEIAEALGIPTNLARPIDWAKGFGGREKMRDLEEIILRGSCQDVARFLQKGPVPKLLSGICVKLIMKFEATDILSYLEKSHKDLFRTTFPGPTLTTKASAVYGKTSILEWWLTSPSFSSDRAYTNEAMNGASHAGFLHVLDWWKQSGLPPKYTEAALEKASAKGKIEVLEWWRKASLHHGTESENWYSRIANISGNLFTPRTDAPLRLKIGRSICYAAQNGEVGTIRWWDRSGIPYPHEESVARFASTYGQVGVLEVWKELKGEKMIFDNQVLVGPTRNGHRDVLEWWKNSGFRVEYRPCDIEEALEDAADRVRPPVRSWWIENGLNLGVGTFEWMQVKVLWGGMRDVMYPSVGAFPF